jgi:hypothetical protein
LSALYLLFLPPLFSPVDLETDGAAGYDYTVDDQPFAAEQQGKQPPLSIPISPISFPLILALDFATVLASSYF